MNISLGACLRDGRRVGIEWRKRRTNGGTVVHAVLRHEGELSPDDLDRCLAEIGDGERMIGATARRRPAKSASL
jgi:hypothetical protein